MAEHFQPPAATGPALRGLGLSVAALGESSFPDEYFSGLLGLADIDMVSAFIIQGGGKPSYLFARSASHDQNAFARDASQRYAAAFWKNDPAIQRLMDGTSRSQLPVVYQQAWDRIPASDYRSWCYERPGVEDRISLTSRSSQRQILVNVYRSSSKGSFTQADFARCADCAQLLTALVGKHALMEEARDHAPLHPTPECIEARMERSLPLLSRREREVCANILMGMSVKEIARVRALELSSVITYKRRAYGKLNVSDRRGLQRAYSTASG